MNSSASIPDRQPASAIPFQGLLPFDKAQSATRSRRRGLSITLAALGIPEVMGYTKIIGTPVITGLYTLLLPVLVFAFFGSSRHLVVSADSATAAMIAAAFASLSLCRSRPNYVALNILTGIRACMFHARAHSASGISRGLFVADGARRIPFRCRRAGRTRRIARHARPRKKRPRLSPATPVHFSACAANPPAHAVHRAGSARHHRRL